MNEKELTLRITGKNSDGEYWLHIDGSEQSAGFNIGDPSGMIAAELLMAASGHTYTRIDPNTRIMSAMATPADSKAALARMIADARADGMREAAGIADDCVSIAQECLANADGIGERMAWRSAIARAQMLRDAILAAIPKGGE